MPITVAARAMNQQDAELLSAKHEALVRAAHFYDYDLGKGDWSVNQAVCPEAPAFLIVQMSEGDPSAQSFFTAVISRNGGPVRIIPVLHHGIPTRWKFGEDLQQRQFLERVIPAGDTTLAKAPTDSTQLAGCYAALVGVTIGHRDDWNFVIVERVLEGAVREIAFAGTEPNGAPMIWHIQFDSHGRIAEMEATNGEDLRSVPDAGTPGSKPVPASSPPAPGNLRSIPSTIVAQPNSQLVSNQPVATDIRPIPKMAMPGPKPVPASNSPADAELHATPDRLLTRPAPAPRTNPFDKTDARHTSDAAVARPKRVPATAGTAPRSVPSADTAQARAIPAPNSLAQNHIRSIPSAAMPQPKPVAASDQEVGADLKPIPNKATTKPKLISSSNPPERTPIH